MPGGFEADAYTRSLRVVRQNGEEYEVNTVKDMDYSIYTMRNGDVVTAEAIINRFTNKLETVALSIVPVSTSSAVN